MRYTANEINTKGTIISIPRTKKLLQSERNKMNKALYYLYDMGYSSTPSVYEQKEILKAITSEYGIGVLNLLTNYTVGTLDITPLMLKYAITKSTNKELKEVLNVLHTYLRSNDIVNTLDKALTSPVLKSNKTDEVNISAKIVISGILLSFKCPLDFTNDALLDCIKIPDNKKIQKYTLKDLSLKALCLVLGISETTFEQHKQSNSSLFIKGLTFNEECEFVSLLVTGKIEADGEYGKVLNSSILKYYKEDVKTYYNRDSFEYIVEIQAFKLKNQFMKLARENLSDLEPLMLTMDDYYVLADKFEGELVKDDLANINIDIIGNYVIDWNTGKEFPKINNLKGISGEFISVKQAKAEKFIIKGLPTELVNITDKGKIVKEMYYNINQLYNDYNENPLPLMGNRYEFVFTDINNILKRYNCSTDYELFTLILKSIDVPQDIEEDKKDLFKRLTADLVRGLVRMDCGYSEFKPFFFDFTNRISEDLFNRACFEAERISKNYIE